MKNKLHRQLALITGARTRRLCKKIPNWPGIRRVSVLALAAEAKDAILKRIRLELRLSFDLRHFRFLWQEPYRPFRKTQLGIRNRISDLAKPFADQKTKLGVSK